jgi:hypothetical protein
VACHAGVVRAVCRAGVVIVFNYANYHIISLLSNSMKNPSYSRRPIMKRSLSSASFSVSVLRQGALRYAMDDTAGFFDQSRTEKFLEKFIELDVDSQPDVIVN